MKHFHYLHRYLKLYRNFLEYLQNHPRHYLQYLQVSWRMIKLTWKAWLPPTNIKLFNFTFVTQRSFYKMMIKENWHTRVKSCHTERHDISELFSLFCKFTLRNRLPCKKGWVGHPPPSVLTVLKSMYVETL